MALFKSRTSTCSRSQERCNYCTGGRVTIHFRVRGADGVESPAMRVENCRACRGTGWR